MVREGRKKMLGQWKGGVHFEDPKSQDTGTVYYASNVLSTTLVQWCRSSGTRYSESSTFA